MDRAYSVFSIKSINEDKRVLEGIATSPAIDRVGDSIDPLGCQFNNPSPLLWQHKHEQPVGLVSFNKPTKAGVTFRAEIPRIAEEGALRDRVEEAWSSVKSGLIRAVSIGFRALDGEIDRLASGGVRFKKIEIMELSLVTIPANQDCSITSIKRIDDQFRYGGNAAENISVAPSPLAESMGDEDEPGMLSQREFDEAFDAAKTYVDKSFATIWERLADIEKRVAAPDDVRGIGVKYQGGYQRAQAYLKGDVVTFSGDMWVALKDVNEGEAPGPASHLSWQLAARHGKPIKKGMT